jgi:peptidoglycan/xylan/chitin deacetylase (PgdA/CDA1 family)
MQINFTYPEGKKKALTFSYDDGVVEDRQLVNIFNKYKVKGTFHINAGLLDKGNRISAGEVAELYKGHEVSCHSLTHPYLETLSKESVITEILEDRRILEALAGYPVVGLSFPYGTYDSQLLDILKSLGIVYSRTVKATGSFSPPDNFLKWHPTCHHSHDIMEKAEAFKKAYRSLALFYVWGHSYEFERNHNWDLIEDFCAEVSGDDTVWYATNIEIYEYLAALKQVRFSVDRKLVKNLSSDTVWFTVEEELIKIESGGLINLN